MKIKLVLYPQNEVDALYDIHYLQKLYKVKSLGLWYQYICNRSLAVGLCTKYQVITDKLDQKQLIKS